MGFVFFCGCFGFCGFHFVFCAVYFVYVSKGEAQDFFSCLLFAFYVFGFMVLR